MCVCLCKYSLMVCVCVTEKKRGTFLRLQRGGGGGEAAEESQEVRNKEKQSIAKLKNETYSPFI